MEAKKEEEQEEKVAKGRRAGENGERTRGDRGGSPSSNFLPLLGKLRLASRCGAIEGRKRAAGRRYKRGLMQLVLREKEKEKQKKREREKDGVYSYIGGYRGIKVPLRQTRSRFSASAYVTADES